MHSDYKQKCSQLSECIRALFPLPGQFLSNEEVCFALVIVFILEDEVSDSMVLIQAPKERNNLPKAGNDPTHTHTKQPHSFPEAPEGTSALGGPSLCAWKDVNTVCLRCCEKSAWLR